MSDDGDKELVPINGNSLPHGFSDSTVKRAITLMLGCRSVAQAHRLLRIELEAQDRPVPVYETLWLWARQSEECYQALTSESKRELVAISTDAARAWGANMIELADSEAGIKPTEVGINYGIAMQRRTDWENAGRGSSVTVPIQINYRQK